MTVQQRLLSGSSGNNIDHAPWHTAAIDRKVRHCLRFNDQGIDFGTG